MRWASALPRSWFTDLAPQSKLGYSWYGDPNLVARCSAGVRLTGFAFCRQRQIGTLVLGLRLACGTALVDERTLLLPPRDSLPLLLAPGSPLSGLLRGRSLAQVFQLSLLHLPQQISP